MKTIHTIDEVTNPRFGTLDQYLVDFAGETWNLFTKKPYLAQGVVSVISLHDTAEFSGWVYVQNSDDYTFSLPHSTTHPVLVAMGRRFYDYNERSGAPEVPGMDKAIKELTGRYRRGWPKVELPL